MAERSDEELLAGIRSYWAAQDPLPDGLVARLQAAAALAASETDLDIDIELMLLVERTEELAGARGASTATYTLRFAYDGVDLLLRIAADGARTSRIDGWVVPPAPLTVTAQRDGDLGWSDETTLEIGAAGRFELGGLAPGLLRLRLEPADGGTAFMTPAFEL